jgi:hypothetical protein
MLFGLRVLAGWFLGFGHRLGERVDPAEQRADLFVGDAERGEVGAGERRRLP